MGQRDEGAGQEFARSGRLMVCFPPPLHHAVQSLSIPCIYLIGALRYMSIHLHPNKENPTCFRVYRKIEGVEYQYYFSFSVGKKNAKKLATEVDAKLDQQVKAMKLRKELPVNKLFDKSGKVRGIRRTKRVRDGRGTSELLIARPPGMAAKEISMNCRSFSEAYDIAVNYILEKTNIESTKEINDLFMKSKKYVLNK